MGNDRSKADISLFIWLHDGYINCKKLQQSSVEGHVMLCTDSETATFGLSLHISYQRTRKKTLIFTLTKG